MIRRIQSAAVRRGAGSKRVWACSGGLFSWLLLIGGCGDGSGGMFGDPSAGAGQNLTATVTVSAPAASVGTDVTLDAGNSTGLKGNETFQWDFDGDGTADLTTTTPTVSHAFPTSGRYDVTVTILNPRGRSSAVSH